MKHVTAQIDLAALRFNLELVRRLCPTSRIMAMVKADAYGHGLLPVARALSGADAFAVARLHEATLLRRNGVRHRILLLATLLEVDDLSVCSSYDIDVTAHDEYSLSLILQQASCSRLRVWLDLDSGMHRTGLSPDKFVSADRALSRHKGITELVHMTHFSSAGEKPPTVMRQQMSCFHQCHSLCSRAPISLANSAALISEPDTRSDWVRPGIMLYGDNPVPSLTVPLRAAMTLRAPIISIRNIAAGEAVGYGRSWASSRKSRIGTVAIGYGDGYPRHAPSGTPVLVGTQMAALAGRISMDSLTIDISDCDGINVGDDVTLWGGHLSAAKVAECAGTISYQLFTSLQRRVPRDYID